MKYTIIAIGALVLVGVAVYFYNPPAATAPSATDDTASADTNPATTDTDASSSELQGAGTFADFFGRGESVYCTFSSSEYEADGSGEGEFWYADERMRVEALTRADGEIYTSNMINDGDTIYVWSGTAAGMQAIMMDADSSDQMMDTETGQTDTPVNMDQPVTYECEPWTARDTQFVPPSEIEFVDMEAMMQGMFEGEMRGTPEGMNF